MTPAAQAAEERRLIAEAVQRLLGRTPQRSDGKLTIASLAIEAGVSRQRLYEHHADVIADFPDPGKRHSRHQPRNLSAPLAACRGTRTHLRA